MRDPHIILIAGFLAFLVYSFPGFMSTDSAAQLLQGRGSEPRTDWHPPLMAALWGVLDGIAAGPFLMLLLQGGLFLYGLYNLFRRVTTGLCAACVSVCILLFPPVLSVMAVVWKDSLMAGATLAGVAAITSKRCSVRVAGVVLLTLAAGLRANAPFVVIPLVAILLPVSSLRKLQRTIAATLIAVAMSAAAMLSNMTLTQEPEYPWHNSLAVFDIVGTIRHARAPNDEVLQRVHELNLTARDELRVRARRIYIPRAHWSTVRTHEAFFELPANARERAAVERAWRGLVTTYPRAYLEHRWQVFCELIGLSDQPLFSSVYTRFTENDAQAYMLGHHARHSTMQARWNDALHAIENSWLFRPYMYLAIGVALLFLLRGVPALALALLASAFVNQASLFLAAPSADYRYSHWMIVCVVVSAVIIFIARMRRQECARAAPSPS